MFAITKAFFVIALVILVLIGAIQKWKVAKGKIKKFLSLIDQEESPVTEGNKRSTRIFLSIYLTAILPKQISNQLLLFLCLLLCFVGFGYNEFVYPKIPFYDYILVLASGYVLVRLCTYFISTKDEIELMFGALWVLMILLFLDYVFIRGISESALKGPVRFRVIISIIIMLYIPFFFSMKKIIDGFRSIQLISGIAIVTFLVPVVSTLLLFGIYNLSHADTLPGSITSTTSLEILKRFTESGDVYHFLMVIQFGAQNVFQLPSVSLISSGVPIFQYLFGMILMLIVIGFFVSYATSTVADLRQKRQGRKDLIP